MCYWFRVSTNLITIIYINYYIIYVYHLEITQRSGVLVLLRLLNNIYNYIY